MKAERSQPSKQGNLAGDPGTEEPKNHWGGLKALGRVSLVFTRFP